MAYQYDDNVTYDPEADLDHDWVQVGHILNVSSNRPPILIGENFCSSQAGTPINDPGIAAQIPAPGMSMGHLSLMPHSPSSYPSSTDGSVRAPDGPERQDPANHFLHVAPATGLGEAQHRRRVSYDEMENQINHAPSHWAAPAPPTTERAFRASLEALHRTWLRQDPHLIAGPTDTVQATRAKSSATASVLLSSGGLSSSSSGWRSSSVDPVTGSGGWVGESMAGGWPMEIPEYAIDEEEVEVEEEEEEEAAAEQGDE